MRYSPSVKVMVLRSQLKQYLEKPENKKGVWVQSVGLYDMGLSKKDVHYILTEEV